jgi:hypothetical protein
MDISEPNKVFNFSNLTLTNPQTIQGGSSYFSRIALTNTLNKDKSLYIQLPKCKTRQGIVTSKKEKYCDFLFEKDGSHETDELFEWIDHLEKKCQGLIDSKKTLWFHNDISLEDIENMMVPVCRLYKSGKNILIRSFIDVLKKNGKEKCLAYDERENLVALDDIKETNNVIPLLLVDGVIFTTKSFEISIKVIQIMVCDDVLENEPKHCLIKASSNQVVKKMEQTATEEQTINTSGYKFELSSNTMPSRQISTVQQPVTVTQPSSSQLIEPSENLSKQEFGKINNVGEMEEFQLDFNNIKETIIIKSKNEIYKNLIAKTNEFKKKYMDAVTSAKKFKEKYKLNGITDVDLSDFEEEDEEEVD